MAKCVGSVNRWTPDQTHLVDTEFLTQTPRQAETVIKQRVEQVAGDSLLDIATDFIRIKQAALSEDDFVLDSRQIQEGLVDKLKVLINDTVATVKSISSCNSLTSSTKHGYFIQYTYGVIEQLEHLCQTVARPSEIDQKLYMEEQRKLVISDESIALHSLTSIWTAIIAILSEFCNEAKTVFSDTQSDDLDEDEALGGGSNFLDELETSRARNLLTKIVLMDLIVSSWIKFNRLVKYEDLVKSIPFLCPCNMRLFFDTLDGAAETSTKDGLKAGDQILCDLLDSVLDYERKLSMMTVSARRLNIIPMEPCYAGTDKGQLAYFIIWHLYALSTRAKQSSSKRQLEASRTLMERSLVIVKDSFITDKNISRLSPHQEERYKLLFHMTSVWCEQHPGHNHNTILLNHLFQFAHSIDSLPKLETKYFNNSDFSLNDSTLFQLCAKLMNDTKTYNADGQTQVTNEGSLTEDQKSLVASWNLLLEKHVSNKAPVASAAK